MKRKIVLTFVISACLLIGISYAKENKRGSNEALNGSFNELNVEVGYKFMENGNRIVFVYDENKNKHDFVVTKVQVAGTFNKWKLSDEWSLKKADEQKNIWVLETASEKVKIPGNSGQPEFKFVINGEIWLDANSTISGYQLAGNNLIVFPEDDITEIIQKIDNSKNIKKLSEFNLNNYEDLHNISNFRLITGTKKLFRSYHPFKKSRMEYDTEEMRIKIVKKFMEEYGVRSIISLSGDEKPDISLGEEMSQYTKKIFENKHVLFAECSYSLVYYESNSPQFAEHIKKIVEFIIEPDIPAPVMIHCRLGTDRTGVVSSVLAALCGASWDDIKSDYQKSNNMYINEFRDYKLLKYSLEKLINKEITNETNMKEEISQYFIKGNFLTQKQLDELYNKLCE